MNLRPVEKGGLGEPADAVRGELKRERSAQTALAAALPRPEERDDLAGSRNLLLN
jgi:hypothetical protein